MSSRTIIRSYYKYLVLYNFGLCVHVLPIKVFVYKDILMIMGTHCAVNKYQETCLVVMSCCQETRLVVMFCCK